jgi:D-Tyr-tRNAtyr deacylase
MATTYTWDVSTVDTYPSHTDDNENTNSDVIFNVHYRVTGDDEANSDTSIGTVNLSVEDTSDFTAFADVTLQNVEDWVIAALGTEAVQNIKDSIQARLTEKATPTVVTKTVGAVVETPEE